LALQWSDDERGRWSSYWYCRIKFAGFCLLNSVGIRAEEKQFSSRNKELQTPRRTRAKHIKEHGHGDKYCTLLPWHMSVQHGVILYTRRGNAVSWRSSRVNKDYK
jgi:hypothetical protein